MTAWKFFGFSVLLGSEFGFWREPVGDFAEKNFFDRGIKSREVVVDAAPFVIATGELDAGTPLVSFQMTVDGFEEFGKVRRSRSRDGNAATETVHEQSRNDFRFVAAGEILEFEGRRRL